MKCLKGIAIISFCLLVGQVANSIIDFPAPTSVYGMFCLFFLLLTKLVKVDDVECVGIFLLSGLAMFFAPSGVGLMEKYSVIQDVVLPLVLVLILTTIVTMVVTMKTVQLARKVGKKR